MSRYFHDLIKFAIFLQHIDRLRPLSPRESYPAGNANINRARNLCIHIPPFSPRFSIRKFLSFGKFFTLPVCPIVDISKCTSITRSPTKRETRERKAIVNIFILLHFLIKDDKKEGMKEKYIFTLLETRCTDSL